MTNTVLLLVVIALVCQGCVSAPQGHNVQLESMGDGSIDCGALDLGTKVAGSNEFGDALGAGVGEVEGTAGYTNLKSGALLDGDSATGWQEGEAGAAEGISKLTTLAKAGNEDASGNSYGTGSASGDNPYVHHSNCATVQKEPDCADDE